MKKLFSKRPKFSKGSRSKEQKSQETAAQRPTNKAPLVAITFHHRDELSLGENRVRFGRAAFHWGILILPDKTTKGKLCHAFDVSDSPSIGPTGLTVNAECNWIFRPKSNVDPDTSGHMVGMAIIGRLVDDQQLSSLKDMLASVPLPVKGRDPPENCVTWTFAAIEAMQSAGIVPPFDLDEFGNWGLNYATSFFAVGKRLPAEDYVGVTK